MLYSQQPVVLYCFQRSGTNSRSTQESGLSREVCKEAEKIRRSWKVREEAEKMRRSWKFWIL